ncbi:LamG-like jellyroll fold domain-containing protein [Haloferula sp. BvORR071]|uniref:LamG-like jellyroll fold domain-containing protein n=1 Tax=Haloferula sp. BvORR071 TaxID=1396141 RepID=UPI00054D1400|nr:LamG-like jellyroll fold domain-containing protein [Haloferula sp. BvORR071]
MKSHRALPTAAALTLLVALLLSCCLMAQDYGLTVRPSVGAFYDNAFPPEAPSVPANWSTVVAFPNLSFLNPVGLAPIPGTNKLVVWEREGRIWCFDNNPATSTKTLVVDLSANTQGWDDSGLLGVALHPDFANNHQMWVWYCWRGGIAGHTDDTGPIMGNATTRPELGTPNRNRLSRFVLNANFQTSQAGEYVVIDQKRSTVWHSGGGMFFHPANGFLYITNGDDVNPDETQRINRSLFSGVIRIDVDQRGGAISHAPTLRPFNEVSPTWPRYQVPNDNPFVGQAGAIEELWAIGLRSPHRMTLDALTGRIFIGDVGQSSREEVTAIEPSDPPGLNLQWSRIEGLDGDLVPPYIGTNKRPIIDYGHGDGVGSAVVGGYVYRGTEFPELVGKYIFGDNVSRFIWYLDESTTPASKVFLAQLPKGEGVNSGSDYQGLGSFGVDANNELYMCQLGTTAGKIYKLQRGGPAPGSPLPATLGATGLFSNLAALTPSNKLIPYALNAPFWSDGAIKTRFAAIPNSSNIGFQSTGEWSFPTGSVLVKHFELPVSEVDPNIKRRLETRVIVKKSDGSVYGATYKWRADQSDADLLDSGLSESIPIATAPIGTLTGQDIGGPALLGSTLRSGTQVTITAGGTGIGGTSDQFHFASQQRTGDFDLAVRIESLAQSDLSSKAGLMVRESLAADAKQVTAFVFPSNADRGSNVGGYEFQYRAATGSNATPVYPPLPQPRVNFPDTWLRLQRTGDTFIAYSSADGFNWLEYARTTLDLPDQVYFGMAVTANAGSPVTTAKFHVDSRRQIWSYPSRQDCVRCHNPNAGGVLGPSTRQFNREMPYPGSAVTDNQIRAWNHVGLFSNAPTEQAIPGLEKLVAHTDTSASLQERARSYLDANCSYCHRPGGAEAQWDGRFATPFESQGIYYGIVNNKLGNPDARVVVPQSLGDSILHFRVNKVGKDQMPPLGRNVVDKAGVQMLEQWINSLQPETIAPPSLLVATAVSQTQINLAWSDQSNNEAGFSLERSFDGLSFTALAIVGPGVMSYSDTTAEPFTIHHYRIASFSDHVYSSYTNVAAAATDVGPAAAEIRIVGNGRVISNNDMVPAFSDGTDFGSAVSPGGQVTHTFTLENLGNASLTLSGTPRIRIDGSGATSFSVVAQPAASVSGPGGVTFDIRFQPTGTGIKTATIAIPSNDPSEPETSFAVTGTGVASNLIGWWKFDETSGTVGSDSSGNGRNVSLTGPLAAWEPGLLGGALKFTGVDNQGVSIASQAALNPTQAITIAAWVYASDWDSNRRIVQKGNSDNQYRLLSEDGDLVWEIFNVAQVRATRPAAKRWFHVAATYDRANMRLYVNGTQVGSAPATAAIPATNNAFNIGAKSPAAPGNDHMNGYIDDVRLYSRALPASEIALLALQSASVSITATDNTAQKGTNNTGTFTVTRSGLLEQDLQVGLTTAYGPTQALPRIDYTLAPLPTDFRIPAGQSSATLTLEALDRDIATGPQSVTLSLAEATGYIAGSSSAQIQILDSPLNNWKVSAFGSLAGAQAAAAQDSADADGDGVNVLLEAALGGTPTGNDTPRLPDGEIEIIGGLPYLTSTYVRPKPTLGGISYHHRASFELSAHVWDEAVMLPGYPQDNGNGTETVKTRTLLPMDAQPRQFLRLEVTRP